MAGTRLIDNRKRWLGENEEQMKFRRGPQGHDNCMTALQASMAAMRQLCHDAESRSEKQTVRSGHDQAWVEEICGDGSLVAKVNAELTALRPDAR